MKKTVKIIIAIIFLTIGAVFLLRYLEDKNYRNEGQELIDRVEVFRTSKGRLPNSTSEFMVDNEMGTGPYYERINDEEYKVYFTIGFDEYYTYYSKNKAWKNEP